MQCFISLILSYKIRKKKALLRCTTNLASTGHKLHFQPKHLAWAKLAAINIKMAVSWLRCVVDSSEEFHIIYTIIKYSEKKALLPCTANQVGTGHNLHFLPKTQLGPNWQQSTTKMDVARLRCNADSSEAFHIIDINIYGEENYSFAPLYREPSQHSHFSC